MSEAKNEKFIVRVIRKRTEKEPGIENGVKTSRQESVDQIYEQEFDTFDVGKFAVDLNKKTGTEKDEKSLKMGDDDVNKILEKEITEDDYQMTEKGFGK